MFVKMIHPDLPGQEITVSDLAVEIHERSGWETTGPAPAPAAPPEVRVPDGYVVIHHPASGQDAEVPAESVDSYRPSGWLTKTEHEANQAAQAQAKTAGKSKESAAKAAASKEE